VSASAAHHKIYGDASPASEATAALVSVADERSALTTPQAAERLGRSLAWVKRHARELGGHIEAGVWRFPPDVIAQVAIERETSTIRQKITFAAGPGGRDFNVGPRSAAVLERLERGEQTVRIAIELQEAPDFVLKVREQWVRAHVADRERVILTCRACSRPSDPQCGYCLDCAPHMARLSEEQRRVLAGQEVPTAIRCSCGRVVDEGVCTTCVEGITAAVEGGAVVVRAGTRVLKTLPLSMLMPPTEAPAGPAPTPAEAPVVSDATRAIVDHARRVIADARATVPEDQ
jgi:hypothetical protein